MSVEQTIHNLKKEKLSVIACLQKIVETHKIEIGDVYTIDYCPGFLGIIIEREFGGTEIHRYLCDDGDIDNAVQFRTRELDKDVRNKLIYKLSVYGSLFSDSVLSKYFDLDPATIRLILLKMV